MMPSAVRKPTYPAGRRCIQASSPDRRPAAAKIVRQCKIYCGTILLMTTRSPAKAIQLLQRDGAEQSWCVRLVGRQTLQRRVHAKAGLAVGASRYPRYPLRTKVERRWAGPHDVHIGDLAGLSVSRLTGTGEQMPNAEKRAKARFLVDTRRGFASADEWSAARFESADPGDLGLPNPVEPRTLSTFSTAGLREGAMPPSTPRLGFGGSGDLDLR
jgi:hypothetical protein